MADKIYLRRGNIADIPTLAQGEPGFALDTKKLYIGTATGNQGIVSSAPSAATWIAPTLLNSWINSGGGENIAGYFKDDLGMLHVRGMIKNGVITNGTILFNLPVGYRPSSNQRNLVNNNVTTGYLLITGTGDVKIDGNVTSSASLCLDTISFRVEQ